MQLPKLEEDWHGDLGHRVPPEEWPEIVPSITPPDKFKPKCCKRGGDNSKYSIGHGRRGRGNG